MSHDYSLGHRCRDCGCKVPNGATRCEQHRQAFAAQNRAERGSEPKAARDRATAPAAVTLPPARVRLSDVTETPVHWYWRNWIPFGGITIVDGDPGVGKTTMLLERIARGTRGELCGEPVGALVISTEDSLEHTLVPRLRVAGADLDRIHAPRDVWNLEENLAVLEAHVTQTNARVLFLDPLVAFLGVDTHKDGDVRRVLGPVARLAERRHLAVIGVRHLRKSSDGPALYRGGGSIGIVGAARSGLIVGRDPVDPKRLVVASTKSNLGPAPPSLAWRLVPPHPGPDGPCGVEWLGETSVTADALVGPREEPGRADEAEGWLEAQLTVGPLQTKALKAQAMRDGIAWRTVERAKQELGVKARQTANGWTWSLVTVADGGLP